MGKGQNEPIANINTLYDENNWLSAVFSFMNAGLVITDAQVDDNPIIYANPKFYEMTGYEPSEIIGKNCRFLQGNDTDKHIVKGIRLAVEKKKKGKFILKNYRKDGTGFWNELYIAPVLDKEGVCTHYVGIQHDVTDEIKFGL